MRLHSFALRLLAIPAFHGCVSTTACSAPIAGDDPASNRAALDPCTPPPPPPPPVAAPPKLFGIDVGRAGPYALARTENDAFEIVAIDANDLSIKDPIFSFADYAKTSGATLRPTSIAMGSDSGGNECIYTVVDDGAHGAIFSVNVDGTAPHLLHTFLGGADGGTPIGKLGIIGGTEILGITSEGKGTTFMLHNYTAPTFATTHTFTGGPNDGEAPAFGLTIRGGEVWGVTTRGGANGRGIVFSLFDDGFDYQTLQSFGPDESPTSPLVDAQAVAGPNAGLRGILNDSRANGGGSTLYGLGWSGGNYSLLKPLPSPAASGTFSSAIELGSLSPIKQIYACGVDGLFQMTPDSVTIANVADPSLTGGESCDDLVKVRDDLAVAIVHGSSGLPKVITIQN